jgi:hypothetical protein
VTTPVDPARVRPEEVVRRKYKIVVATVGYGCQPDLNDRFRTPPEFALVRHPRVRADCGNFCGSSVLSPTGSSPYLQIGHNEARDGACCDPCRSQLNNR